MIKTEIRCANCKKPMSFHVEMYSRGRCPMCGFKGANSVTICETIEAPYRVVRINPFWKFWKKQFIREYLK